MLLHLLLGLEGFLFPKIQIGIDFCEGLPQIWQDERLRIVGGELFASHLHQVCVMSFFINSKEELLLDGVELLFLSVLIE